MGLGHFRLQHREAERLLERLLADPDDATVGDELGDFIRLHFQEEEEGLIPLVTRFLPADTGPVPVVLEEHRTIRELLDAPGRQVRRLASLLPMHFAKEEEVLLRFAEAHLTEEETARFGDDA